MNDDLIYNIHVCFSHFPTRCFTSSILHANKGWREKERHNYENKYDILNMKRMINIKLFYTIAHQQAVHLSCS